MIPPQERGRSRTPKSTVVLTPSTTTYRDTDRHRHAMQRPPAQRRQAAQIAQHQSSIHISHSHLHRRHPHINPARKSKSKGRVRKPALIREKDHLEDESPTDDQVRNMTDDAYLSAEGVDSEVVPPAIPAPAPSRHLPAPPTSPSVTVLRMPRGRPAVLFPCDEASELDAVRTMWVRQGRSKRAMEIVMLEGLVKLSDDPADKAARSHLHDPVDLTSPGSSTSSGPSALFSSIVTSTSVSTVTSPAVYQLERDKDKDLDLDVGTLRIASLLSEKARNSSAVDALHALSTFIAEDAPRHVVSSPSVTPSPSATPATSSPSSRSATPSRPAAPSRPTTPPPKLILVSADESPLHLLSSLPPEAYPRGTRRHKYQQHQQQHQRQRSHSVSVPLAPPRHSHSRPRSSSAASLYISRSSQRSEFPYPGASAGSGSELGWRKTLESFINLVGRLPGAYLPTAIEEGSAHAYRHTHSDTRTHARSQSVPPRRAAAFMSTSSPHPFLPLRELQFSSSHLNNNYNHGDACDYAHDAPLPLTPLARARSDSPPARTTHAHSPAPHAPPLAVPPAHPARTADAAAAARREPALYAPAGGAEPRDVGPRGGECGGVGGVPPGGVLWEWRLVGVGRVAVGRGEAGGGAGPGPGSGGGNAGGGGKGGAKGREDVDREGRFWTGKEVVVGVAVEGGGRVR
ncbi:hypothetical protein BU17DRAFT_91926 [Hysterangium stoloniferum]|nr:hypothetical protein BU17DRAFT_91926 [Hysterangium stoloniferum]